MGEQQQKRLRSELVELVRKLTGRSTDAKARAANDISKCMSEQHGDAGLRQGIAGAGAIAPLVAMLQLDNDECKQQAAAALANLAAADDDAIGQGIVGAGALGPLVALLHLDDLGCKRQAAAALDNLAAADDDAIRQGIVDAGAIAKALGFGDLELSSSSTFAAM